MFVGCMEADLTTGSLCSIFKIRSMKIIKFTHKVLHIFNKDEEFPSPEDTVMQGEGNYYYFQIFTHHFFHFPLSHTISGSMRTFWLNYKGKRKYSYIYIYIND